MNKHNVKDFIGDILHIDIYKIKYVLYAVPIAHSYFTQVLLAELSFLLLDVYVDVSLF